ncbi:MAG: aminoacyl-tRNA hydrolase [Planctomycetaceae bacterium]|jgi:PTH1 family peptidyl-tRNA hydrolase|nr:aminoacyl-tRNA hydrolase [Planctomycetaceae bacterium]
MKIVVGLGNPGRQYQETRHNIGFMILAELAFRLKSVKPKLRFQGDLVETKFGEEQTLLLAPNTFMNRSGLSVSEAVRFYKLPLEHLLVVCDDLNLPFGKLRMRTSGSSGGQNGLNDIIQKLSSDAFCRLRFGIDRPVDNVNAANYVLSKFLPNEQKKLPDLKIEAANAVECWIKNGPQETMNRYNHT